ncbi:hypothetical protein [Enterocloster bolteae]|nr:hypothetical protein [Enterocloster bolteae]MCQ5146219.1 hypothetical protein [Enterocloster bolteae]
MFKVKLSFDTDRLEQDISNPAKDRYDVGCESVNKRGLEAILY